LDVPLRAGRGFTSQDSASTRTAMVNETAARRLFPGRDPIGQRLRIGEIAYEGVGVVADYTHVRLQGHDWDPKVYLPLTATRTDATRVEFLIRATDDPAAV